MRCTRAPATENIRAVPGSGHAARWTHQCSRPTKDVAFVPISDSLNDRIDAAYRAKYRGCRCDIGAYEFSNRIFAEGFQ